MARISFSFICITFLLAFSLAITSSGARKSANIYELQRGDFTVKVTNWGAVILSVVLPDSNGKMDDIVLGYEGIGPYLNDTTYFGALIGRVANRISGSRFVLNGKPYRLYRNDGKHSLHGGHRGFSDVFWSVKEKVDGEESYITLYYRSFDGEQGFPGDLDVYVTYKLSADYELTVSMEAKPLNKPTPVNLIQHSYWNLAGEGHGTILGHKVQIFGSVVTPLDDEFIPTGEFVSVKGTPYDFLQPEEVGSRIHESSVKGGYNINYVLESPVDSEGLRKVAVVECKKSGRTMELRSDQPGVQFYTGNSLNDQGKNGHVYPQYGGLCLETQGFPNAVNQPNFPSQIVNPGEVYKHTMIFKFSF